MSSENNQDPQINCCHKNKNGFFCKFIFTFLLMCTAAFLTIELADFKLKVTNMVTNIDYLTKKVVPQELKYYHDLAMCYNSSMTAVNSDTMKLFNYINSVLSYLECDPDFPGKLMMITDNLNQITSQVNVTLFQNDMHMMACSLHQLVYKTNAC
jgi:hypothetical protein